MASTDDMTHSRWARWAAPVGLAAGYIALAWLGLSLASEGSEVSPFWPAAGLAIGVLWRCGMHLWPGLLLGSGLANHLLTGAAWPTSIAIAIGTTVGLGGSAWLLRRLGANPHLERASDPLLVLLMAALGSAVSGCVGATCVMLGGMSSDGVFLSTLRTWWVGDLAGVMGAIGMVSTIRWEPAAFLRQRREILVLGLLVVLALTLALILSSPGQTGLSPWAFVLFPPLLYASVRLGPPGAAATLAIISLLAAVLTSQGIGPFVSISDGSRIHFPFQLFIIAASATTLVLAAYARSQAMAQNALRDSELRYRLVADHARDVICLHELDGRYRWISPSSALVMGWKASDLIGRDPYDFFHPDDVQRIRNQSHEPLLKTLQPTCIQFRFRRPDGSWIWLETVNQAVRDELGRPIAIQTCSRDITQRKLDEERLAEMQRSAALSERMASIGTLAGGVAHEFNNLNAVVMGNVELALRRPDLPPDARRRLEQIRDAVDREKGIVDALLAFSRSERGPSEIVEIGQIVSTTLALARRTLRQRRVALTVEIPDLPTFALIPAGSLGQVLLNLLLNACDAVDRRHDPHVWVSLHRDGHHSKLEIRDNGVGIDPDVLPRIFEPFYSTKGEHAIGDHGQPWLRGTGLGLSVCQTLVGQMGGTISVHSTPGHGTSFTVYVPLADAPRPSARAQGGTAPCARVLVVDDEPEIRRLLCEHLTAAGHVAVEAKDGQQALDHLGQEEIDVVMLNWCMPGVDGQGVLEHMELHPERRWPPVIVVSGWAGGGSGIDRWRREIAGELRKPFSLEQVRASIERALCGHGLDDDDSGSTQP
jgi:PAS domain S-box-containing protein